MKDFEATVKIMVSQDYNKFKILEGNRDILPTKIKKLKESISNGLDLLNYCPIIINENWEIIDGQHRYTVSKELGRPVFYVVMRKEMHIKQVAEMNMNTDKWKAIDFVDCFQKMGNDHYKKLYAFIINQGYNPSLSASLLMKNVPNDSGQTMIHVKSGTFKVKYEEEVMQFLEWTRPLDKYVDKPKSRAFLGAMKELKESGDFKLETLLKKLESSGDRITQQATKNNYLSAIEDAYNYHNKIRVRLY